MGDGRDRITIAWQMLAHLGVTLADLETTVDRRPQTPTVAEYLPRGKSVV